MMTAILTFLAQHWKTFGCLFIVLASWATFKYQQHEIYIKDQKIIQLKNQITAFSKLGEKERASYESENVSVHQVSKPATFPTPGNKREQDHRK